MFYFSCFEYFMEGIFEISSEYLNLKPNFLFSLFKIMDLSYHCLLIIIYSSLIKFFHKAYFFTNYHKHY